MLLPPAFESLSAVGFSVTVGTSVRPSVVAVGRLVGVAVFKKQDNASVILEFLVQHYFV